jgi:hypothetical protein
MAALLGYSVSAISSRASGPFGADVVACTGILSRTHQRLYIVKHDGLHVRAPVFSCVQVMPAANVPLHTKH